MNKFAVEINDLTFSIGKSVLLRDITTHVVKGEISGLIGPSGAGKTTLIRTILGLYKPTNGTISVLGDEAGARGLRSKIGYVTQSPSTYSDLSVQENMTYFASQHGSNQDEITQILEIVELDETETEWSAASLAVSAHAYRWLLPCLESQSY